KPQAGVPTGEGGRGTSRAAAAETAARAVLVKAKEDYDRYKTLFEQRSVPERRFQDATRDYRTAQADVDAAVAKREKAEADRLQIEIANLAVAQKQRVRERADENLRLPRLIALEA